MIICGRASSRYNGHDSVEDVLDDKRRQVLFGLVYREDGDDQEIISRGSIMRCPLFSNMLMYQEGVRHSIIRQAHSD